MAQKALALEQLEASKQIEQSQKLLVLHWPEFVERAAQVQV